MWNQQEEIPFNPRNQPKARCFGRQSALTVEGTRLMKHDQPVGDTVNLEMAPKDAHQVNWDQKITLQLSESELPVFAALCLGYLQEVEFARPGKGIKIERQANRLFFSASQGQGRQYALPVPIGQVFQITSLVLAQLSKQSCVQDGSLVLAAIRGAASLYRKA